VHKLLARQLNRAFGGVVPAGLDGFLRAIDDAYHSSDADRAGVERSLELMSQELSERNERLRRDIDAQRRIEEALRQREVEFLDLIQNIPQMIMVQRGSTYVFVNRSGLNTLGYESIDELAGVPVLDLIHPDDRQIVAGHMSSIDQSGTLEGRVEVRFLRRDGDNATVEITLVREMLFDGKPAVLLAGTDVTEQKKLRQRLLLADRLASVGTLAAGVAHEINNPLAYVLGNLNYVAERVERLTCLDDDEEDDELREAVTEAVQGANRVREIVQGMKIFSRADQDSTDEVDLASVLDSAISIANNEIRHRARLVKDYDNVPLILGNAGRLGQVFVNLLVNAAQAIADGAADLNEVRVGLKTVGGMVNITVRDTGEGMPPEVQRRIFDPFFTTKPIGVGSGLGLAICHGIIASHGGEIQVESQAGKGTTFTVRLPIRECTKATEPQAETPALSTPTARRVLVVDDDPLVGKSLRRTLGAHDVDLVTNGKQAIEHLEQRRYEVIISDLMMPEMTGMEFHQVVAARWPEHAASMVFLTGGAFSAAAIAFLERVPNRKLEKPFDANALRALVNGE